MKLSPVLLATFLLVALVAPLGAPLQLPPGSLIEDFEDDTVGAPPSSEPWYTYEEGTAVSTSTSGSGGNPGQYYNRDRVTTGTDKLFYLPNVDMCDAESVEFDIRMGSNGWRQNIAVGIVDRSHLHSDEMIQNIGSSWADGFIFYDPDSGNGNNAVHFGASGGTNTLNGAQINAGGTGLANVWVTFKIDQIDCPGAEARGTMSGGATGSTIRDDGGSISELDTIYFGRVNNQAFTENYDIDNIKVNGVPIALPSITADVEITVSALVGFAVDETGTTAVAREGGGTTVRVYGGQTLVEGGNVTTSCNQDWGVQTSRTGTHMVYLTCTGGEPEGLRIRSNQLGTPSTPQGCGFAPTDFDVNFDADLEDLRHIHRVSGFDIDYSNCSQKGLNEASFVVAFSTYGGKVGAYGKLMINNFPDDEDVHVVSFDPTGAPQVDQVCSFRDKDNGQRYVAASTQNGVTKVYKLDIQASGAGQVIDVALTDHATGTGPFGQGSAIACHNKAVYVGKVDSLVRGNRDTFTTTWTATTDDILVHGLAVSGDGLWLASADADTDKVYVSHAGNGTPVVEFAIPAGDYKAVAIDYSGQNVWVATSTRIARFEVTPYTTGTFVAPNPSQDDAIFDDFDGTSPGGSLIDLGAAAEATGLSEEAIGVVLTLFLVVVLGGLFASFAGAKGAMAGAFSGMVMAVPMGLLQLWVAVAMAVIAAAVLALSFGRR